MSSRKLRQVGILPGLLFLFLAGAAAAKHPVADSGDTSNFALRAPESRLNGWQSGLLKFMTAHPRLNAEQARAIEGLSDLDDGAAFAYTLEPSTRTVFAKRLDRLVPVLSYGDYLKMLRSFDDELRVWLVHNGLASKAEAATDTCTCSSGGGCAGGYSCQNVTCVHEGGTTHDGRCGEIIQN